MISPSVGIISPASQIKIFPFLSLADEIISPFSNLAGVSSLVLRKLSACAFPRASAIASAKLAKIKVRSRTIKIIKLYAKLPCVFSPVNIQRQTMNITAVPISTVNITGLRIIIVGFSFVIECLSASCTKSFWNKDIFLVAILF